MQQQKKKGNGFKSVLFWIVGLTALGGMMDLDGEAFSLIIGLFFLVVIPFFVIRAVIRAVGTKRKANVHTHDRIDHRSDLKVNPATGKVERPATRTAAAHSPKEHWKQQLDGLLANGTIDRAEYRALMNRRF